jgi:hypothetical protein
MTCLGRIGIIFRGGFGIQRTVAIGKNFYSSLAETVTVGRKGFVTAMKESLGIKVKSREVIGVCTLVWSDPTTFETARLTEGGKCEEVIDNPRSRVGALWPL